MNRDDAVRVVAVRMYGGRRWESLADEQRTYWLTMAEVAAAALVAAGWGDLAAERSHNPNPERLEQAIADAEAEIARLRDAIADVAALMLERDRRGASWVVNRIRDRLNTLALRGES
jgi:uncharacterized protein (UPF0264 family)